MALMVVAAEQDIELNGQNKPTIKRIMMLPLLTDILSKKHLEQEFLDSGVLSLFKNWLESPNGSLPNATIRASILNILTHILPVDISSEDPREQLKRMNSKSGSNLPKVIWRVESLNSKSQSEDGDGEIAKGNKVGHLSIFLTVADSATLPSGWTRFAHYGFALIDQTDCGNSIAGVLMHEFNAMDSSWGYPSFLALSELEDPERGYRVNDACLVEAYISTDMTDGLTSHELMLETDLDKHETKEADGVTVKAATDNQTTMKTQQAIEPEEPTEEAMNTFFSSLDSELLSSKIVVSQEKTKEALPKLIGEALDMTPESLKELADRAAKAVQEKSFISAKESIKLTIIRNLDRNATRYK
ncbi:hypothetical protein V6N12_047095 [Hibiscus sabdariffa]|uniref:MATH domain-containing protein n=1 Tax=Hibiscus sabdariffa TaxID=183260 RepID=A0ABR1Z6Q2_9ROSI